MNKSKISVELVTRTSKKSGNQYSALEITFSNGYKKLVFLDQAELFMAQTLENNSK